jgi:hypothetical protein
MRFLTHIWLDKGKRARLYCLWAFRWLLGGQDALILRFICSRSDSRALLRSS